MEAQLLTNDERNEYKRAVRRFAGNPRIPEFKQKFNEGITHTYLGSPLKDLITEKEFRTILYTPTLDENGRRIFRKKGKKNGRAHALPNVILDNADRKVVFSQLVKSIAQECGRIPDDCIMNCIGQTLGYTHAIWDATKRDMIMHGYTFKAIYNGYLVEMPDPNKKRIAEIDAELAKLKQERMDLQKKLVTQ